MFAVMGCGSTDKRFSARFDLREQTQAWELAAAWPLERAANARGPESPQVEGAFLVSAEYSGCPHCGAGGFVKCGRCSGLSCWPGGCSTVRGATTQAMSISQLRPSLRAIEALPCHPRPGELPVERSSPTTLSIIAGPSRSTTERDRYSSESRCGSPTTTQINLRRWLSRR